MATVKPALHGKSLQTGMSPDNTKGEPTGLAFERYFTDGKTSPFDTLEWEKRTALIGNEKGVTIFRQEGVEVPKNWSQTATNIVCSKYFHGKPGTREREGSVRQLIGRVASTIVRWGEEGGYFANAESREAFRDELTHLLVEQKMSFNSPVWFNVGVQPKPQCSACFINSVQDNMESIMGLTRTEGMLFKWGSGTGTNFSTLRGSKESLSGGGIASGPVSFMKGFDAFAGVIKSGGKTRRAAKMVILNVDHPDIVDFIECKMKEERKAHVLIEQGYDSAIDGDAYGSIFFQNANHSVRVTDDFMRAAEEDRDWWTRNVADGQPADKLRARDLLLKIADSTWRCGDPGMQYDTTVNRWHTSKNTARINASNPCSEYMFLDDTACNLASLNLMKYLGPNGQFDVAAFKHAVDVTITAQEILVDNASYPTPRIAENSHAFRPLGLGYANLGALLMSLALPYDSDEGRDVAGAITALMCGEAYAQSARIAECMGPFPGYEVNQEPMLDVIRMHRDAMRGINPEHLQADLFLAAQDSWDTALHQGEKFGYKNSQVTVLAPTGTIGFMMDCDTTGIEPDLALVKHKKLVGGGLIKIVNNTVPQALMSLSYTPEQTSEIVSHIDKEGTIEGAPYLKAEHLPVFDCSLTPAGGGRSINWTGHVKMMAAAQPFLSGAISKTINMPEESTIEDIMQAYIESWKMGLKAVAIYRDNSKRSQPLSAAGQKKDEKKAEVAPVAGHPVQRDLLREVLTPLGFILLSAPDGAACLALAQHCRPDLFLLDISMAGMDGWTVAETLRTNGHHQARILMVSASALEAHGAPLAQPFHDGYMMKPIDIPRLLESIRQLLKLQWQYEVDQIPVPHWKPETGSRPPVKHVEELIGLGQLGYIRAIQVKLDEIGSDYPEHADFVSQMRSLVDRFDLDQYMATLKNLHSYDH